MRRKLTQITVALGIGSALTFGATAASAQPQGSTIEGCPYGWVCVYPHNSWNGGHPSLKFYHYGAHNLSGQYGDKRFFNNQSGGATARLCTGYNGTGCKGNQSAGTYYHYNFTPINSVFLG